MLATILESGCRALALSGAIWLLLRLIRLRDLRLEKFIWTIVLLVSVLMPIGMRLFRIPLPMQALPVGISRPSGVDTWPLAIYLLVTALLVGRFVVGLCIAFRIRQSAHKAPAMGGALLDVRISGAVRGPSSCGATILLPPESQEWDAGKLRAVLAHEAAHIAQRDYLCLWLAALNASIFWFNPMAHWLHRRLNLLAELTSDAAAVSALGDRTAYAELLVSLAAAGQPPRAMVAMAARSTLTPRLDRLLERDMSSMNLGRISRCALTACVVILAATAAGAATAPLVLNDAQDAAVKLVGGEPLQNFYPKALRKRHVEGTVDCRLAIDAAGHVTDAQALIGTASDPRLAAPALEAVKTFQFNNTLGVPVIKTIRVGFKLR